MFQNNNGLDPRVTSPPLTFNSFDYSDVYRPEMFLAGFVADNNQLMRIRLRTIRSHVQANWKLPVKTGFGTVYAKVLKEILLRKDRLWSARIPFRCIQAYFEDMEELLAALSERANPNALLKIAVATSAYAGSCSTGRFYLWLGDCGTSRLGACRMYKSCGALRSSAQLWKHFRKQG